MSSRSLQISTAVFLAAAGAFTWWLLEHTADTVLSRKGPRPQAARRGAGARAEERQEFMEPDLPGEDGPVPVTEPAGELQNTVRDTIIAGLHLDDVPLSDLLDELKRRCDINFVNRADPGLRVSVHHDRTSLQDVLESLSAATGVAFDIQSNAIVLLAPGRSPQMTTNTFLLAETGWPGVDLSAGITDSDGARTMLERHGVTMPDGAIISYAPASHRLIVRNTLAQLKRIRRLALIGPPDKPFVWQPVRFGSREYIRDDQVATFYAIGKLPAADSVSFSAGPENARVMEWRRDDRVMILNGIQYALDLPVRMSDGSFWISRADLAWTLEPLLRPRRSPNTRPLTTAVMDMGPAPVSGEASKAAALSVGARLKATLEAAGWTVVTTSVDDGTLSRESRRARAAEFPDAVLISIQTNAGMGTALETLVPLPVPGPADPLRPPALALATAVHTSCLRELRAADGGIKSAGSDILEGLRLPGIVIRLGAIPAGAAENIDRDGRVASAIAAGLETYRRAVRRNPLLQR